MCLNKEPLLLPGLSAGEQILFRGTFAIDAAAEAMSDRVCFMNWFFGGVLTLGFGLPWTMYTCSPCGAEERARERLAGTVLLLSDKAVYFDQQEYPTDKCCGSEKMPRYSRRVALEDIVDVQLTTPEQWLCQGESNLVDLVIHSMAESVQLSNIQIGVNNTTFARRVPVIVCRGLSNASEFKTALERVCGKALQPPTQLPSIEMPPSGIVEGGQFNGQRILKVARQDAPFFAKKMANETWCITIGFSALSAGVATPCLCPLLAPCGSERRFENQLRSHRLFVTETHVHFEADAFDTNGCFGKGLRMPSQRKSVPLDHILHMNISWVDSSTGMKQCTDSFRISMLNAHTASDTVVYNNIWGGSVVADIQFPGVIDGEAFIAAVLEARERYISGKSTGALLEAI